MISLKKAGLTSLALVALTVAPAATAAASSANNSSSDEQHRQACGMDKQWLETSIQGDYFEIMGGKLALSKTKDRAVDKLAMTLIADHSKSLKDAIKLAREVGAPVPSGPSPSQQWELEELGEMSGEMFNHDYSELEVKDHQQDIDETKNEVKWGCNDMVKDDAKKEIPMLEKHLDLSQWALSQHQSER